MPLVEMSNFVNLDGKVSDAQFYFQDNCIIKKNAYFCKKLNIMTTNNIDLIKLAWEDAKPQLGLLIGALIIYLVISAIPSLVLPENVSTLVSQIIAGPFSLGLSYFILSIVRKKDTQISLIFEGFKHFPRAFVAYLLILVLVLVGLVLLIVPGIIVAMMLSQTFYIMADDEEIGAIDAMKKSKEMMEGYKMKFFGLGLLFVGLVLLSAFTLFLGLIVLIPVMQVAFAKFYLELKGDDASIEDQLESNLLG